MTVVCWGNLAKSADSVQRIEQSIQAYIEGHDENPNAHMGADYSLGAHRLQTEIDHLPYSARNSLLYPTARTYKAIVDLAGNGDTISIQNAIDYVNSCGGGTILIKAGIYTLSTDLTIYSNVEILGEDDDLVTVKFSSNAYHIKIIGTSGTHKRNITISRINFEGLQNLAGWKNIEVKYCDDVIIERCKFTTTGVQYERPHAIYVEYCSRCNIINCRSIEIVNAFYLKDSIQCSVENCYFYMLGGDCVGLESSDHILIRNNLAKLCATALVYDYGNSDKTKCYENTIQDCADYAFVCTTSNNWIISNNHIVNAGESYGGISLEESNRNIISNNEIIGLAYDGIHLINSDHNVISNNVIYSCDGTGIKITDAASSKNILSSNQVYNNATAQITDSGTGTVNANNIVTS
ncbi:MAG: right-handed parallel beta-helix repeat-containing protein [Bacteroidales bacterium]